MAPTVTLKISNPHRSAYPTINLRKFFNMVFVEPDGNELHIYTATVFGGAKQSKEEDIKNKKVPCPELLAKECLLTFEYQVTYKDGSKTDADDIDVNDLTEQFLSRTPHDVDQHSTTTNFDEIAKVWDSIKKLENDDDIIQKLCELYPDKYPASKDVPPVSAATHNADDPVFYIDGDTDKGSSHKCVARKGSFSKKGVPYGYQLAVSSSSVAGIEAINWVKTTIKLKHAFLETNTDSDRNINFAVQFDNATDYYTPDFTWYFAPPRNYVVDDTAKLTIGKKKDVPNKVTRVTDDTTVHFNEWLIEKIRERKKSRVEFSDYTGADPYFFTNTTEKSVKVRLSFSNHEKHGNQQFLVGMIVSLVLGFCSDIGRYETFHKLSCCCKEDTFCVCENLCRMLSILLPIVIISAFFAVCFRQKDCIPKKEKRKPQDNAAIRWRWVGLISTAFLLFYINVLWIALPRLLKLIYHDTHFWHWSVIGTFWVLSLLGSIKYVRYCGKDKNLIDFF